MRVLVACEFSGTVRDAFAAKGHDAWSCDLLPTERAGNHFECDVREVLGLEWDLMICHPPCTHLAVSGSRWFSAKEKEQAEALAFVRALLTAPIPHIALENPVSIISSRVREPEQIIQPWQFGHGETKATCLWLKRLPPLAPTLIVPGREQRVHLMPPSPDRWKERSRTFPGIAAANGRPVGHPFSIPRRTAFDRLTALVALQTFQPSTIRPMTQTIAKIAHTPGPWQIQQPVGAQYGKMCEPTILAETTKICTLPALSNVRGDVRENAAEIAANARLIAAAPSLLYACQEVVARHDAQARRENFTSCGCEVCTSLRIAIYEATA